jgi:hypothetical protein
MIIMEVPTFLDGLSVIFFPELIGIMVLWTQFLVKIRQWSDELWTKSKSSNQEYGYEEKVRLELITGSRNKTWVQLVLTRMRDNVPRLPIYTLNIYSTLLAAQAISKVVAWASSLLSLHFKLFKRLCLEVQGIFKAVAWAWSCLACTPSYPKAIPYTSRYCHYFVTTS